MDSDHVTIQIEDEEQINVRQLEWKPFIWKIFKVCLIICLIWLIEKCNGLQFHAHLKVLNLIVQLINKFEEDRAVAAAPAAPAIPVDSAERPDNCISTKI